jgi:hypothetical protein
MNCIQKTHPHFDEKVPSCCVLNIMVLQRMLPFQPSAAMLPALLRPVSLGSILHRCFCKRQVQNHKNTRGCIAAIACMHQLAVATAHTMHQDDSAAENIQLSSADSCSCQR